MPTLERDSEVFVLALDEGENRFTPAFCDEVGALLDEVEAAPGPKALVTAGTGKFWSNGLDLDWMMGHPDEVAGFVSRVQALFARVLTLPMVTVAALNGHCFAAGAMLALAHDQRVMRADRGFFCLPEVDIAIPFTAGMSALITARLPVTAALEAMTTGRRYGAAQALAAGIVDASAAAEEVRATAVSRAAALTGKAGPTLGAIKREMYSAVTAALAAPTPLSLPQG